MPSLGNNDRAEWSLVLNNAKNLRDDVDDPNVDIAIVAYGSGIAMLRLESPNSTRCRC